MAINDGLVAHFSPTITKGLSRELLGTCGDGTPYNGASIVSSSDSATEGTHYFNFVRASSQYYRWTDNSSGNLLSPMANTGLMTVAFWMNAPTEAPQGVMDKAGFNNPEWGLRGWSAPSLTMFADQSGYGGYELEQTCVGGVFGGTWKHYAVVIDTINGTLEWYVDGVNFDSDTFTGQALGYWNNISDVFQIGRFGGFYLNGQLDTIRVYQRLLTGGEIAELYNAKRAEIFNSPYNRLFGKGNYASADPALEGHWELQDNAASTTVVDRSGNGRNGTFVGGNTADFSTTPGQESWLARSLDFDGTTDRVEIGAAFLDTYASTALTVAARFNPNATTTTYRTIFSDRPASGVHGFILYHYQDDVQFLVGNGTAWQTITDSTTIYSSATNWGIVGTLNGTSQKLYANGSQVGSQTISGTYSPNTSSQTRFGLSGHSMSWPMDGQMSDFAIFSRELDAAEVAELDAGPEPYLLSGTPSISGTIQRGQSVTLDPGVWSAANNDSVGGLDYTYSLYSYSDTSGSDERLEKVITTPLTNPKVLLSGAAIEGRYLRVVVTASNDGGSDPSEVYTSAYTAAVAAGSDSFIGASYNALFGKGRHLQDTSLEGFWDLEDTGGGTTVLDSSTNGRNGTTVNSVVSDYSATTPANSGGSGKKPIWRSTCFQGTNTIGEYINCGDIPLGHSGADFTVAAYYRSIINTGSGFIASVYDNQSGSYREWLFRTVDGELDAIWYDDGAGIDWARKKADVTEGIGHWNHVAATYDASGTNGGRWSIYRNGVLEASTTDTLQGTPADDIDDTAGLVSLLGANANIASRQYQCDTALFSRILSTSELSELTAGPEPIILTSVGAPTGTAQVGQTLTAQTGTWDSQNNGAISAYNYQWYRADDTAGTNLTLIAGATSSTYTLVGADENKYITVRVGSSNDGGEDEAERTFSAYSAQVTAGGGQTGAASESLSFTDTASATVDTSESVSESLSFTDAASAALDTSDSVSESLVFTDSATATVGQTSSLTLEDQVGALFGSGITSAGSAITLGRTAQIGDLIVVTLVSDQTFEAFQFSDDGGHTYTAAVNSIPSGGKITAVGYAVVTNGVVTAVTVTPDNSILDVTAVMVATISNPQTVYFVDAAYGTNTESGGFVTSPEVKIFGGTTGVGVSTLMGPTGDDTSSVSLTAESPWLEDQTGSVVGFEAVGAYVTGRSAGNISHSSAIESGLQGTFAIVSVSPESGESLRETLTFTDTVTAILHTSAEASDSIAFADSATADTGGAASVSDGLTLTDTTEAIAATAGEASESLVFADEATAVVVSPESGLAQDSLVFTDEASANSALTDDASDSLVFTDEATATLSSSATVEDSLTFTDTASESAGQTGDSDDALVFTDDVTAIVGQGNTASDDLVFTDDVSVQASLSDSVDDSLVFTDDVTVVKGTSASVDDQLIFSDQARLVIPVGWIDLESMTASVPFATIHATRPCS